MKRIILLFLTLSASYAMAAPIAYVSFADGNFGTLDLGTGSFTILGASIPNPSGLAYDTSGALFGSDFLSEELYRIGPSTGAISLVGTMPVAPGDSTGLAGVNGTLYTLGFLQELYRVDPATASTTLIGATGIAPATDPSTIDAVTEAGLGSSIYLTWRLASDTADNLYRIDPNTGKATLVGPVEGAAHLTGSGVIGGSLYAFTFDPNNIYRIDVNTGVATLVGSYSGADAPVFAAAPVPEPSGIAVVGMLFVACCLVRSRSRIAKLTIRYRFRTA